MFARLSRETKQHHALADNYRLTMFGGGTDLACYTAFLKLIYGFEAPVESALQMTTGLDEWIDFRGRGQLRLLRSDLQALGVVDPSSVQRCSTVFPFRHAAEALGWMYVIERNTLLHGVIERHLRGRLPEVLRAAGSYLAGLQRSSGLRLRDLGGAMDIVSTDASTAERIVLAAKAAFRAQHGWYDRAVPPRVRVA